MFKDNIVGSPSIIFSQYHTSGKALIQGCRDWNDWSIHEHNIEIQFAFHGGEKKIGPYKAEEFFQENNTVFEIYGDNSQTSFLLKTLFIHYLPQRTHNF